MQKKYFFSIITIAVFALFIRIFIADPSRISGDCMQPAVMDGQFCLVSKGALYVRELCIGDIITFYHEDRMWFSRILALENDTIQINEGEILVNGKGFNDAGIKRNWEKWSNGEHGVGKSFKIPAKHVYVLSDNMATNHDDSRHFGAIPNSQISGLMWYY